ncbi:MAG TPA: class I SAM-dependent methyltransferase [Solirubrobacteraceae bacterium]|nr:class I SAM-dependent methyltransferase [Solirubrobacteraceae bacterium]
MPARTDGGGSAAPNEWSDPNRVADYLAREIPHRRVAEQLLVRALPRRIERFVDLGTGAGRLLELIHGEHPGARGIGTDISRPMLDRARAALAGQDALQLYEHDLAEPLSALPAMACAEPLDAVVSALAIHHLQDERKRSLFAEIRELLRPSGVFANLDLTTSPTPAVHAEFRAAVGRRDDDPADRLADMDEQLRWLRDVGFVYVDCRFKWLELTLFIAVRG